MWKFLPFIAVVIFAQIAAGEQKPTCTDAVNSLRKVMKQHLAIERLGKHWMDNHLQALTSRYLNYVDPDLLCNPGNRKLSSEAAKLAAIPFLSFLSPNLCNICEQVVETGRQAFSGLMLQYPQIIPTILDNYPSGKYVCSKILLGCPAPSEETIAVAGLPIEETIAAVGALTSDFKVGATAEPQCKNVSDVQCLECSACQTALFILQIQFLNNQAFINNVTADFKTDFCVKFFSNIFGTNASALCTKYGDDIIGGVFRIVHVTLLPDIFCTKTVSACTVPGEATDPGHCIQELCTQLNDVLEALVGCITNKDVRIAVQVLVDILEPFLETACSFLI